MLIQKSHCPMNQKQLLKNRGKSKLGAMYDHNLDIVNKHILLNIHNFDVLGIIIYDGNMME